MLSGKVSIGRMQSELLGNSESDLIWLYSLHLQTYLQLVSHGKRMLFSEDLGPKGTFLACINHLSDGGTLILNELQRIAPGCARFTRDMAQYFGMRCSANYYLTPPYAQGFVRHEDLYDIFILQVAGEKLWTIWPSAERGGDSEAYQYTLSEGDILYVPAHVFHCAHTAQSYSAHITIGLHGPTVGDFLRLALNTHQGVEDRSAERKFLENTFSVNVLTSMREKLERNDLMMAMKQTFAKHLDSTQFAPSQSAFVNSLTTQKSRSERHLYLTSGVEICVFKESKETWRLRFSLSNDVSEVLLNAQQGQQISEMFQSRTMALSHSMRPKSFSVIEWNAFLEFAITHSIVS